MVVLNDNKGSPKFQDGKPNNPFTSNLPPFTSATQGKSEVNEPPTPDKAKKTDYMSTNDVAKIIGVDRTTVMPQWDSRAVLN